MTAFRSSPRKRRFIRHALLAACGAASLSAAHAATPCDGMTAIAIDGARVAWSIAVPGPAFTAPDGNTYADVPAFCRVGVTATPTPDSLINIELWMPSASWNGRFEGVGNGGYAGTVALGVPAMIAGLKQGFSVATTDLGTAPSTNNDGDALIGHPEKWTDFGSRATHLMTTISKQLMASYYDQGPQYSYFNGCSTGGQQAMVTAQRYPSDYNGILSGDPAANRTHVHTAALWNYAAMHATPTSLFTSDQVQAITNAVVQACAVKSGGLATDSFLTDPRSCDWDPAALACGVPGIGTSCLGPDQIVAARKIYAGAHDPVTGHLIFPGSVKGGESDSQFGWFGIEANPEPPFDSLFKWTFGPTWLWQGFDFDQNLAQVDQLLAPMLNANNADLSGFNSAGGKLLAYHGWADPLITPQDSIDYYLRAMQTQNGSAQVQLQKTQNFFRLFMVPGMYHCAYGPGPNAFGNLFSGQAVAPPPPSNDADHDAFTALQRWVEAGVPPQRIIATKYVQDQPALGVQMSRPLCPYPKVAKYSGSGDVNDAANFVCADAPGGNNPMPASEYLH
ncbi:tannase/feruloyl esterase family alpha/beta hydrolase [Noviherbaspirillum pedocola]|uniref:Tannase/feruloyl esterase family alpha/beta hydrolase n=1 Tax=Noviherbaspirillum pedocola TaxID=2801341 RepID=A0A934SSG0_9BURK|nr:tannase/feruloyl esterase family alpha/beta hydrolase [Noviherbaspirillum pedocola]MBK4734418.1 tannase/feruloyl esterase family alpha/beta hydrolase [Noviherbaspirillum pedocola]